MFGYFEGWVQPGGAAYLSFWEVTVINLAGGVLPMSGAASVQYNFDPTALTPASLSALSAANVTGAWWPAGATSLAGSLGAWSAVNGAENVTLAANPEMSCLYNPPNQKGNDPLAPDAQYYWTPFWDAGSPTRYGDPATGAVRNFCSDAHTQPPDLVFTSSAQSNYGAVLGSYMKNNAEGVDCGPGAPQAVGCPTSGFDAPEVGYYGAGAIPFAGAVAYGLVGTGQALTGPFAGLANDGGSFSFLAIESLPAASVGVVSPNATAALSLLQLKGFKCLLAGVNPGGEAYRISCAPEVYTARSKGTITACLQPYVLTPFTNPLCAQSNTRGRPLGFPAPTVWSATGIAAAAAAGTSAQGSGFVASAGGVGRRRRLSGGGGADAVAQAAAQAQAQAQRAARRLAALEARAAGAAEAAEEAREALAAAEWEAAMAVVAARRRR
jgi:hypothetical protein